MNHKEFEPVGFELPLISPKTPYKQLKVFSDQYWLSDARNHVAKDIAKNGKELLAGYSIEWESVLNNTKILLFDNVRAGEKAIAASGARNIGGIGAGGEWAMHDPQMVYLSGMLLANSVKDSKEFTDFKNLMWKTAENYALKTLPEPKLYMEILNYLLRLKPKTGYGKVIEPLKPLFERGDIEGAYNMIKSRVDSVKRRG